MRYGTKAGCDNHRYNADEIETAISTAMLDFYTLANDEIITEAVNEFSRLHSAATDGLRSELAAVTRQLADAGKAIDRYLSAFERGTFDTDDSHVQTRLTELKEQTRRLRGRKAQLELDLDNPPQALTPGDLTEIHHHIRDIVTGGNP